MPQAGGAGQGKAPPAPAVSGELVVSAHSGLVSERYGCIPTGTAHYCCSGERL